MRTYLVSYAVAMGSLLAGAAVVHNVYRPDLVSSMHSLLSLRTPLLLPAALQEAPASLSVTDVHVVKYWQK